MQEEHKNEEHKQENDLSFLLEDYPVIPHLDSFEELYRETLEAQLIIVKYKDAIRTAKLKLAKAEGEALGKDMVSGRDVKTREAKLGIITYPQHVEIAQLESKLDLSKVRYEMAMLEFKDYFANIDTYIQMQNFLDELEKAEAELEETLEENDEQS